jgi:hypothetical protein
LVAVRKDLVERIAFENAAHIKVSKMSDRNEGGRVVPCAMFDSQSPDLGLDALEEFVEM